MTLRERRSERILLILYVIGFVCLATVLATHQPLLDTSANHANPPDERARFLVPQYISQTGKLPRGSEEQIVIPGYGFSYALYNVFPYIVQGMGMRLASHFTGEEWNLLCVGRMMNVLNGVLMALVVYFLSKKLFSDRRFQWLFCFSVMYWPEVVFVHSYINTDSMCLLATAIIIYALVCGYQNGFCRRDNIYLSAGIILCALSYYNAYGFILVSILLFAAFFLVKEQEKRNWGEMFRKGLFVSALVLAGIGWWFIRSAVLHGGDLLGLRTMQAMKIQYSIDTGYTVMLNTYYNSGRSLWEMLFETDFFSSVINSFIAAYGSMSIWGSTLLYRMLKMCFLVAGAGCVLQVAAPDGKGLLAEMEVRKRLIFHAGLFISMLIPWILVILYSYFVDYQAQGRYVLIAIVPFVYYFVRGLQRLSSGRVKAFPTWLQNAGVVLVGGLFVFYSIFMVFGRALPLYLKIGR